MTDKIKKGVELLENKCGVSADKVEIIEVGSYLYAVFDELTDTYLFPFIAPNDKTAERSIYDAMCSGSDNLLFRFQKTYNLERIVDLRPGKIGVNLKTICKLSELYERISNIEFRRTYTQPVEEKKVELPFETLPVKNQSHDEKVSFLNKLFGKEK